MGIIVLGISISLGELMYNFGVENRGSGLSRLDKLSLAFMSLKLALSCFADKTTGWLFKKRIKLFKTLKAESEFKN